MFPSAKEEISESEEASLIPEATREKLKKAAIFRKFNLQAQN